MLKIKKLMLLVVVMGIILITNQSTETHAAAVAVVTVPNVSNVSQVGDVNAINSTKITLSNEIRTAEYCVQVTLNSDAYVFFTGGYSDANSAEAEALISTKLEVFINSSYTGLKGSYDWGYEKNTDQSNNVSFFLNKGTYFVRVTSHTNYPFYDYEGNINITAVAIPVDEIFKVDQKVSNNKNSVTVSMQNRLGTYIDSVQYTSGSIGIDSKSDNKIWKYNYMGSYFGGKHNTVLLDGLGSGYSFTVKKNGKYTILIEAKDGERYSVVINVQGIDTVKPIIKGVKNNKNYKKSVSVKFFDKGSGIKSAKLNGKRIKSGKKIKKPGKYKLVVTDRAGNKNTIKFRIKRR